MTDSKLRTTVDKCIDLDRTIADLSDELKELKAQLVAEAEGRTEEHSTTENGGASWTATGSDGSIARVTFPAPKLKSSISGTSKELTKIQDACGRHFPTLFQQAPSYKLIPDFRVRATDLLGGGAKKLIKLVQTESAASVAFETKEKE